MYVFSIVKFNINMCIVKNSDIKCKLNIHIVRYFNICGINNSFLSHNYKIYFFLSNSVIVLFNEIVSILVFYVIVNVSTRNYQILEKI